MKKISEELRERLRTEKPSPELVLDLLKETDPEEYCEHDWFQGESSDSPDKCCVLGRIGFEIELDPVLNFRAEEFRSLCPGFNRVSFNYNLAAINNGEHPYYKQDTPYERIKAAMEDLIKLRSNEK